MKGKISEIQDVPFYYISDIHLEFQISHYLEKYKNKDDKQIIEKLVSEMCTSVKQRNENSYLIIAGDTSSVFKHGKIFYEKLVEFWEPEKIVVISGNHELWDPKVKLEENINYYRSYFNSKGINYLQNDMIIIKKEKDLFFHKVLYEKEILQYSENRLRKQTKGAFCVILGGIGFSGLNMENNAYKLDYGISFKGSKEAVLKKERLETEKFNKVYDKLLSSIYNQKVIICSHMRKEDWNKEAYNKNWIYVSGHDHHNYFCVDSEKKVYADNQIGYHSSLYLKYFLINNEYDSFINYQDGIHEIKKDQYLNFNKGKNIHLTFKNNEGKIFMIKKNSYYMFFRYDLVKKKLYLLEGGNEQNVDKNCLQDLRYYYDNIDSYVQNIVQMMKEYDLKQREISNYIKRLGGLGKIHGCIIDVDMPNDCRGSFCHIYLNPLDGKITAYYALDKTKRDVYRDFKHMISDNFFCKQLKYNFDRIEKQDINLIEPIREDTTKIVEKLKTENKEIEDVQIDTGTYIYRVSKEIRKLQYIIDKHVIRSWEEQILDYTDIHKKSKLRNTLNFLVDKNLK
nr:metallophosphoesterase [uncultured Anaerostipes sp.]